MAEIPVITFDPIPDKMLGVDTPFLLFARSTAHVNVQFSIESGGTFADITDVLQLNGLAVGEVTVRATSPATADHLEGYLDQTFQITEPEYYALLDKIGANRKEMNQDYLTLHEVIGLEIPDIYKLTFRITNGSAFMEINEDKYPISDALFVKKFISIAVDFWVGELAAKEARHTENRNRLGDAT